MHARVSTFDIPKDKIDDDIALSRDQITRAVRELRGSRGVYYLVDRDRGRTMAVTLWEDAEAMRESEEAAARIREEGTAEEGGTIVSVERFEVAFQPADVLAGV